MHIQQIITHIEQTNWIELHWVINAYSTSLEWLGRRRQISIDPKIRPPGIEPGTIWFLLKSTVRCSTNWAIAGMPYQPKIPWMKQVWFEIIEKQSVFLTIRLVPVSKKQACIFKQCHRRWIMIWMKKYIISNKQIELN